MAGPAQLIQMVSETTGVPLATVTDIDRRLVKAGLRSKGGRGLNAARMTSLDAARLLTAILGGSQATLAVEAVERYAATSLDKGRSTLGSTTRSGTGTEDLAELPARHGFVDGLAALLDAAAKGAIHRRSAKSGQGRQPTIEVFAFTRATWGRIRIARKADGPRLCAEYRLPKARGSDLHDTGDLEQSRRITERTILPIAKLLGEESHDG